MSTEQNKQLVRRMVEELINQRKLDVIEELFAPDFVEHEQLPPGVPSGRDGVKALFGMQHNAFPDLKATIEHLIAEGDHVVVHMRWEGTHEGDFAGIPPTGNSISNAVIDIMQINGGKIVSHWGVMDQMTFMQQLGVMPTPE
jgi:steroid delta-isomerase-like uncharacterized protein